MSDPEEYLDTAEAAKVLKVSTKVVRRLAAEGRLPGVKIGREWRFRRGDLRNLPPTPRPRP